MNPMETQITEMNRTSENMKYPVDNKKFLCQHKKLHPLTAIKVNIISETMYRDIKKYIQHDSQKYITSEYGEDLSNQKQTNCDIEYDQFFCSDCTKLFCLQIKKKTSVIEK